MASALRMSVNVASSKVATTSALKPVAKPVAVPRVHVAPKRAAKDMMVWTPHDNKMFETFSYLPALTDEQIAKQVDYIVSNGWTPCLEFSNPDLAYIDSASAVRMGPVTPGYYDNRYWTMWKLPMFGCTDGGQVLREVDQCLRAFPDAFVRLVAFDSVKQVQMVGFLVHRPSSAKDWKPVSERQVM